MRLKYARMQGLVESAGTNAIIDEIVRMTIDWQKEMFRKCPGIMGGTRPIQSPGKGMWRR